MKLVITEHTQNDVYTITKYIAADDQEAAKRFIDSLRETYQLITDFPRIGHPAPFVEEGKLYMVSIGTYRNYCLLYILTDEQLCVIGVLNAKRDLPTWYKTRNIEF